MELNKYMGFYSWGIYLAELDRVGVKYHLFRCVSTCEQIGDMPDWLRNCLHDAPEYGQVKDKLPDVKPRELLMFYEEKPSPTGCAVWDILSADHREYYAGGSFEEWKPLLDAWGYKIEERSNLDTITPLPVNDNDQYRLAM